MSTLPDSTMLEITARIIDALGETMDFQRRQGDLWVTAVVGLKVHVQPGHSYYYRSFRGFEDIMDFMAFSTAGTDIRKGDRTAIHGFYYLVDSLQNHVTHLEFGLKKTDERQDG